VRYRTVYCSFIASLAMRRPRVQRHLATHPHLFDHFEIDQSLERLLDSVNLHSEERRDLER